AEASSVADSKALVEKTVEHFGKIDILFLNAGVFRLETIDGLTEEIFDEVHNINVKGPVFTRVTGVMQDESTASPTDPSPTPAESTSLWGMLTYGLSLPERTARSASAMVGGIVHETAGWLLPAAFRSSKTYSAFVQQALDMMIHDVGGVRQEETVAPGSEAHLAQQAVGGLLDLAGAATLHLSPITVLAVFGDVAYGSSFYLRRLSEELKREGIIDETSSVDHVSDLLDALEKTGSKATDAASAPPLSVTAMRETIRQISAEVENVDPRKLIPQAEMQRMWDEMESAAVESNVGIWDVSTTMTLFAIDKLSLSARGALSSVRVAGNLLDEHILDHYKDALQSISERGLYETLAKASEPYLEAAWHNFDSNRDTITEEILEGRMPKKIWTKFIDWWKGRSTSTDNAVASDGRQHAAEAGGSNKPE
ncbi:MAG: SDR family NAD(P)-dependent oxidoreductase, partial [Planctomycetota bacterium]